MAFQSENSDTENDFSSKADVDTTITSTPPSTNVSNQDDTQNDLTEKLKNVNINETEDTVDKYRAIKLLHALNPSNKLRYHDLLQSDFLSEFESTDIYTATIIVKLITWNLCQLPPTDSIGGFLKLASADKYADMYVFTFQETVSLRYLASNNSVINRWTEVILKNLPNGYKVMHKSGLSGLTTILIANPSLSQQLSDINVDTVGLGYLGWYNKGCISLKFSVGKVGDTKLAGLPIQVLNMHLVHGEDTSACKSRMKNLEKVGNSVSLVNSEGHLTPKSTKNVSDKVQRVLQLDDIEMDKISKATISLSGISEPLATNGLIFVAGDLNSRLDGIDRDAILSAIREKQYKVLVGYDELATIMSQNDALIGFEEGRLSFAPTYKLNSAREYDLKRKPAYTDRIAYCGSKTQIRQITYGSLSVDGSDHRPVYSEFCVHSKLFHPELLQKHLLIFEKYYNNVISTMRLLEFEPSEIVQRCCVGIQESVYINFSNPSDELLSYKISEMNKGFFQLATFSIDDPKPKSSIERKSNKRIKFSVLPKSPGTIAAKYSVTLLGFDYQKYVTITFNAETVIGCALDELTENQFENILNCFKFIIAAKSRVGLVSHFSEVENLDSLTPFEQTLLKHITLDTVDFKILAEHNNSANTGSVATMDVIYVWMRYLPGINTGDKRGKAVFSKLIDLIKFLQMDNETAYEHFGFLFNDQYEILDYLESSNH